MINKKIKKTVLSMVLASSMAMPSMVNATYPTIDFSNLLEAITQNYQDMENWAQERMMMMAEMDLQSALSGLGIDAENNAMTNMMVREGKRAQTIQNIEVMEWSIADSDACGTLASQIVKKKTEDDAQDEVEDEKKAAREKNGNFEKTIKLWKDDIKDIISETSDFCESLTDGTLTSDNPIDKSLCMNGDLLTGGTGGKTLTKEESKASKKIVDILVGVIPTYKASERMIDKSVEKKSLQIKEIRIEAFKDMARNSFHEVSSQFRSNGKLPSPFESLKKFDDERFGSEKWLKDIQNVDPDNKNAIYISEITRKIAVMNAFLVHMELKKYKQQLRMEGLQAAMLALEMEPAKL